MQGPLTRRAAMSLAAMLLSGLAVGCQGSNDIPLVEFPKGAPAPPAQTATPKGAQSGPATSQGEPAH